MNRGFYLKTYRKSENGNRHSTSYRSSTHYTTNDYSWWTKQSATAEYKSAAPALNSFFMKIHAHQVTYRYSGRQSVENWGNSVV